MSGLISMPLFPEESWYFCQVRKYAVDGRFGETKRKMELDKDYRLHHYPVLNYILLNGYL